MTVKISLLKGLVGSLCILALISCQSEPSPRTIHGTILIELERGNTQSLDGINVYAIPSQIMEMHIKNNNRLSTKTIGRASRALAPMLKSVYESNLTSDETKEYMKKIKDNLTYAFERKQPHSYLSEIPGAYDTTTTSEGRFTFQLPPGETFYVVARTDSVGNHGQTYTWVKSVPPSHSSEDSIAFRAENQWPTVQDAPVVSPRVHRKAIDLVAKVATGQVPDTIGISNDWGRTIRVAGLHPDSLLTAFSTSSVDSISATPTSSSSNQREDDPSSTL